MGFDTERRGHTQRVGFTLVELLVVVAIIAVLAAIAVPNFLTAQTRAKVSRAKADLRTVATALETYAVDHKTYPFPHVAYKASLSTVYELSTPVAYMVTSLRPDVFPPRHEDLLPPPMPEWGYEPTYMYNSYSGAFGQDFGPKLNVPIFAGYGITSVGPDRLYNGSMLLPLVLDANPIRESAMVNLLYEPTNGTVSSGDIIRWSGKPRKYGSN